MKISFGFKNYTVALIIPLLSVSLLFASANSRAIASSTYQPYPSYPSPVFQKPYNQSSYNPYIPTVQQNQFGIYSPSPVNSFDQSKQNIPGNPCYPLCDFDPYHPQASAKADRLRGTPDDLVKVMSVEADKSVVADYTYAYDADGNIARITNSAADKPKGVFDKIDYTYDGVNRITKVVTTYGSKTTEENFTYSPSGNILTRNFKNQSGNIENWTYKYNDETSTQKPSSIVSDKTGTTTFAIDRNGNITSKTDPSGQVTSYEWSYRNELVKVTIGSSVWKFTYGPDGKRWSQTLPNGKVVTTMSPDYTVEFKPQGVDGCQLAQGCESHKNYLRNNGQIAASFETTDGTKPTALYYHPDHLGSTNIITNEKGDLVQYEDYFTFGAPNQVLSSLSKQEAKQYLGKEYDKDLGLSYLEARYYDPTVGQFLSSDPVSLHSPEKLLGDPQQLNLYSYARNNPIVLSDPEGLCLGIGSWSCRQMYSTAWSGATTAGSLALDYGKYKAQSEWNNYLQWRENNAKFFAENPWVERSLEAAMILQGGVKMEEGEIMLPKTNGKTPSIEEPIKTPKLTTPLEPTIPEVKIGELPRNVQDSLGTWEKNDWKSGSRYGLRGGRPWNNQDSQLPQGNYQEFDVNRKVPSQNRDANRFIRNQDTGDLYYTDTHYGQQPGTPFQKVIK